MRKIIFILSIILFVNASFGATYCIGQVRRLGVRTNGEVYVASTSGFNYTNICSLSSTLYGVTKEVCNDWYKKLNASYITKKNAAVHFGSEVNCTMGAGAPTENPTGVESF